MCLPFNSSWVVMLMDLENAEEKKGMSEHDYIHN